ncbi:MAG: hypothetical protein Q8903_03700, partial [Bacteroidota bacterium]|nr:hypothetical protein [Bacteroidota bacterium]
AIEGIQKLSASLNDQNEEQKLTDITIINQICRVQMAQLENSGEQLASALNHIEDGLSTLKGEIQSIYITSSSLGIEDKREESYINTITRGLDVVNKELQVNSGLRNNFYKSVKQITDTVVALTNLIEEIEDVGNEIELISLNSRIKASQSGREGAALDVLAESIQGLSNDAKDLTGKIREYVNAINCSAAELMKYNSTDQDKHDNESEGLNNIMNNLQQFESDSASLFNNLTEKVNSLNEETNDSVLFGSVKEILKLNIYKMIEQLEDIITYTAPFCKESSEMKDDLEQLKNKYTMDSERSIHDRLLNGEDISVDNSDDLGDNIELF